MGGGASRGLQLGQRPRPGHAAAHGIPQPTTPGGQGSGAGHYLRPSCPAAPCSALSSSDRHGGVAAASITGQDCQANCHSTSLPAFTPQHSTAQRSAAQRSAGCHRPSLHHSQLDPRRCRCRPPRPAALRLRLCRSSLPLRRWPTAIPLLLLLLLLLLRLRLLRLLHLAVEFTPPLADARGLPGPRLIGSMHSVGIVAVGGLSRKEESGLQVESVAGAAERAGEGGVGGAQRAGRSRQRCWSHRSAVLLCVQESITPSPPHPPTPGLQIHIPTIHVPALPSALAPPLELTLPTHPPPSAQSAACPHLSAPPPAGHPPPTSQCATRRMALFSLMAVSTRSTPATGQAMRS